MVAAGIGVEQAAHRLDLFGDLLGRAALGALEGHMFQQMRDAVDLGRLVPGAGADPDAEGNGLDRRHMVGDHHHAVGELALLNIEGRAHALTPATLAT